MADVLRSEVEALRDSLATDATLPAVGDYDRGANDTSRRVARLLTTLLKKENDRG